MRGPKLATTKKTDRKRFDEKKKKASAYHQEKKADGKGSSRRKGPWMLQKEIQKRHQKKVRHIRELFCIEWGHGGGDECALP
jgi:hypothetical protein